MAAFALSIVSRADELPAESAASRSRFLMGTVCEVVVEGDAASREAVFAEVARVEDLISTWRDASELSRLNRDGEAVVSPELYAILAEAMRMARATDGTFNPLVGPLVRLWATREAGSVPADEAIICVLPLLDLVAPVFDGPRRRIALPPGASFEEGGFGKGYALDRAAAILSSAGERDFLIDFGGQLMLRSRRPTEVAIANPARRDEPAVLLSMTDGSLSTSSGSEKAFDVGGVRLSHILDPRSGRALPPRGSVSVVSASAFEADILSTALYVMGPRDGLAWANEHGVVAIFIVPTDAGWELLLSDKSNTTGLALRTVGAEFKRRGTTE